MIGLFRKIVTAFFLKGGKKSLIDSSYDVIIIGGGVIGCAVARELSRYDLRIALLEKSADICAGQSRANTAIIHGGYDAKPGTKKA
ncbi:MAG: FAD-dependent oxidoreductase, partial [Anaerolineaceae bacterium]|nr:FAD-dependent oxidoreductase [Anaerolineaceae bacterium]